MNKVAKSKSPIPIRHTIRTDKTNCMLRVVSPTEHSSRRRQPHRTRCPRRDFYEQLGRQCTPNRGWRGPADISGKRFGFSKKKNEHDGISQTATTSNQTYLWTVSPNPSCPNWLSPIAKVRPLLTAKKEESARKRGPKKEQQLPRTSEKKFEKWRLAATSSTK